MSQHDYVLSDQNGAAFRQDLNSALSAIVSQNSGGVEPSPSFAYQWWADTSTGLLKQRNSSNNAWLTVARLADFSLPSVQKQSATYYTTTGSSAAFLLTPALPITSNASGTRFRVTFHVAAGATPTLAVSGQAPLPLKYRDAAGVKQVVTSAEIPSGWVSDVECDGTDWVLLLTPPISKFSASARNVVTAPATLTAAHVGSAISVGGSGTITLPVASTCPSGSILFLQNNTASTTLTVSRQGTDNIHLNGGGSATTTIPGGQSCMLVSNGANLWEVFLGGVTSAVITAALGSGIVGGLNSDLLDGYHANNLPYAGQNYNFTWTTIATGAYMSANSTMNFSGNWGYGIYMVRGNASGVFNGSELCNTVVVVGPEPVVYPYVDLPSSYTTPTFSLSSTGIRATSSGYYAIYKLTKAA